MNRIFQIIVLVIFLSGCSKEKMQLIPDEFRDYVNVFFREGSQRGLNISLDDIDLEIRFGTLSGTIAGQCSFNRNIITIDRDKWNTMTEEKRVWLIFHEMGHCVLDRQHENEITANGECLSIMKGAENGFECSMNYYSEKWWGYYLDELFNSSTPLPDWYTANNQYHAINVLAVIENIDTIADSFIMDNIDFSQYDNYEINFEFKNHNTSVDFLKLYFGNIGFSSCDKCTGTNVRISADMPSETYFENFKGDIQFDSDIKLTVRSVGNDFYFYANERLLHTFEKQLWTGNNTISTTIFNEPIKMNITINELE